MEGCMDRRGLEKVPVPAFIRRGNRDRGTRCDGYHSDNIKHFSMQRQAPKTSRYLGKTTLRPLRADSRAATRISVTIMLFSSEERPEGRSLPRTTARR